MIHSQLCNTFRPIRRGNDFTLIEVLVVISIVSLLIAILLPALSKAKATSRSISCQSQLRQLGIWAITYATDNKGILPTHGDKKYSGYWEELSLTSWHDKTISANLYDGWGDKEGPLWCPEAKIKVSPQRPTPRGITYGINQFMGGNSHVGGVSMPVPRLEILNSRGYWFGEARAVWYSSYQQYDFHPVLSLSNSATASSNWPWSWPNPTLPNAIGHPTHNSSFLYGDGHGNQVSMQTFVDMSSDDRKNFLFAPN